LNFSGDNGLTKGPARRFVVGMLLLAWLNIAAQPCLMAMEMAPDASHASEQTTHSGHGEHASRASDMPGCGHCPPVASDQAAQCETGSAANCELLPGYNVDGRHFDKQAKDVPPQLVLAALSITVDSTATVTPLLPHDIKRLKFTGDPPLNIRHCVFLK
jgi:hypothetical protein